MTANPAWPFPDQSQVKDAAPEKPWPFPSEQPDPASADTKISNTGAVLGQPDKEYGAYGLVKGASSKATPSPDERAVRGLAPEPMPRSDA